MKIQCAGLFMTALVLSLIYCQASFAEEKSKQKDWTVAERLFEAKCKLCHTLDRPKKARKTPEEWQSTVKRMRNYAGIMTDEEAELITDYLSAHFGIEDKPESRN